MNDPIDILRATCALCGVCEAEFVRVATCSCRGGRCECGSCEPYLYGAQQLSPESMYGSLWRMVRFIRGEHVDSVIVSAHAAILAHVKQSLGHMVDDGLCAEIAGDQLDALRRETLCHA